MEYKKSNKYKGYNGDKDYSNEQLHKYLNGCLQKVIKEAETAGIPIQEIEPDVVINTRAQSFWGRCTAVVDRSAVSTIYRIEVTTRLIGTDESSIKNTLMHEVIHTCKGCMNHSDLWKKYAAIVNEKYGYNVKRVTSSEEKGLESSLGIPDIDGAAGDGSSVGNAVHRRRIMPVKYVATCTSCGRSQGYKRAGKVVTRPQNYRCRCGGRIIIRSL
ncbi:MAG: hypothetical protein MRZ64_02380 [[Bacteroides] pectinophilus]|nr:hypothetical protein [[Bacteroides] pectinophilus]